MPELPEVETICRDLNQAVSGKKITQVKVLVNKLVKTTRPAFFKKYLREKVIEKIFRRGKYIIFELKGEKSLLVHLKMTGGFRLKKSEEFDKHTHIIFSLNSGEYLGFVDLRKFGLMALVDKKDFNNSPYLKTLGIDPFDKDFNCEKVMALLKTGKCNIKSFLLDQRKISGVGNIYASEILWKARISPFKKINKLKKGEGKRVANSIPGILKKALLFRGTTIADRRYQDLAGKEGGFGNILKVYDQEGKKCKRCQSRIKRIKQGQRSTYWCPACQNEP